LLKNKNNTSGYNGVYWDKQNKKWRAHITYQNRKYHIGCFDDPVEAGKAYDKKALELFGEFAYLNFPHEPENGGD
jgi:hypothetical protein